MKKLFAILAVMAMTILGASAQIEQKTVRGVVLDTNGNPIAGAEVMAPGGGASIITDADGSFSMTVSPYLKTLTASYAGMGTKKMKVKFDRDMIFKMKTAWRTRGFISAIGNIGWNAYMYEMTGGGGIMGGILGKWGAYGKFVYTNQNDISGTIGVIKGVTSAFYLYLGLGYGSTYDFDYYDYYDKYLSDNSIEVYKNYPGAAFDFGAIIKPSKHFGFSVGVNVATNFDGPYRVGGDIGISYIF